MITTYFAIIEVPVDGTPPPEFGVAASSPAKARLARWAFFRAVYDVLRRHVQIVQVGFPFVIRVAFFQ